MKRTTVAADYMQELINYGGTMVPRGYAYQLLLNVAKAQGHPESQWRVLADRWIQGYELSQRLKAANRG